MMRRGPVRARPIARMFLSFCAGMVFAWWLQAYGPPKPAAHEPAHESSSESPGAAASGDPRSGNSGGPTPTPVGTLLTRRSAEPVGTSGDIPHRQLQVPIDGSNVDAWKGAFYERRDGRQHEAVDILSPRNTPVHAVDDGTVAKLFVSKAGGNTIYQFDPAGRFCYYYAHLERYAEGIAQGVPVSRGQVIGYVGTSGNAPPNTPHLHFAVFQLNEDRHWWQGRPLDPYEIFRRQR
jgi:peptidoglycan LD-endopeptidase LytH